MIPPDDRQLYVPRGRDPLEDLNLLADAIAVSPAPMFNQDGITVAVDNGFIVRVTPALLGDIVFRYVATKVPVIHAGLCEVTFQPYRPDDTTLRKLLMAERIEDGNLAQRLPKMPGREMKLTENQLQQVRDRLKIGEPPERIAPSYNVDAATIRRLAG
jgi:hypothetical protein